MTVANQDIYLLAELRRKDPELALSHSHPFRLSK